MKLVCINTALVPSDFPKLEEGQIYTSDGSPDNDINNDYYCLAEIPWMCDNGYRYGYLKSRFIPLSNIDETELIRERQKQLV